MKAIANRVKEGTWYHNDMFCGIRYLPLPQALKRYKGDEIYIGEQECLE